MALKDFAFKVLKKDKFARCGLIEQMVVPRLRPRARDVLAEALKGGEVRALGQLQNLHHLPDPRFAELGVNFVQVIRFILPEFDLLVRARGFALGFQDALRVGFQDPLDLPRPRDDGGLEDVDLVLVALRLPLDGGGGRHGRRVRLGGHRHARLAVHLPDRHRDVGDELVEILHHLLRDHLGPTDLVLGVRQHGQKHRLREDAEVLQGDVPEVAVDHLLVHVLGVELRLVQLQEAQRLSSGVFRILGRSEGLRRGEEEG